MNSEVEKNEGISQKMYRSIFWLGYLMVFAAAFIPLKINLHKIAINIISFKFHFDQVLHAVVYILICLYFPAGRYLGLTLLKDNSFKKFLFVILALATVTEAVQLAVPSRAFNFFDLVANVIGIGLGVGIIWGCRLKADGRRKNLLKKRSPFRLPPSAFFLLIFISIAYF